MVGEVVQVEEYEQVGEDGYGKPILKAVECAVSNVLVAPGATADIVESNRTDGVLVAYTLYFPKDYAGVLDGKRICVRGEWFRVVGAPRPYNLETTPTAWNMVVGVEKVDG